MVITYVWKMEDVGRGEQHEHVEDGEGVDDKNLEDYGWDDENKSVEDFR